jgi:hypothetical protein
MMGGAFMFGISEIHSCNLPPDRGLRRQAKKDGIRRRG